MIRHDERLVKDAVACSVWNDDNRMDYIYLVRDRYVISMSVFTSQLRSLVSPHAYSQHVPLYLYRS
jgi:hypothetical protein